MDVWCSVLESWLLECSEATATGSPSSGGTAPAPFPPTTADGTDDLTQQQTEQLLAACNLQHEKLLKALFTLFEERNRYSELLERVLRELFVLSRSRVAKLRHFALQFAPSLVFVDLLSLAVGDHKHVSSVELVLLALYNCELLDERGSYRLPYYRLPTLARQSCYHDPSSLGPAAFSADSLVRLETSEQTLPPILGSPFLHLPTASNTTTPHPNPLPLQPHNPAITEGSNSSNSSGRGHSSQPPNGTTVAPGGLQMASITASSRPAILAAVLAAFNAIIPSLHTTSIVYLCKVTSRLVTHGLPRPGSHQQRSSYSESSGGGIVGGSAGGVGGVPALPTPRVAVTADLLLQLVLAAYAAVHSLSEDSENSTKSLNSINGSSTTSLPCYHRRHRHHKRTRSGGCGPGAGETACVCVAIQAIEDVQMRSECDLLPELLQLCYAVTHSLRRRNIITGEGSDSPPLVSAPPPPSTPLAKTCITNASFRTKKLPEDIPIQPAEEVKVNVDGKGLISISEDPDGEGREGEGPNSSHAHSEGGGGASAKLAGILRREGRENKEGRDSGRSVGKDKEGKETDGGKEKSGNKFTPTKFSTGNIVIPGLKRREKDKDKEKNKNGDKKDKENISGNERKSDKKERQKDSGKNQGNGSSNHHHHGMGSNRNSGVFSSTEGSNSVDTADGLSSEDVSPTKGGGANSGRGGANSSRGGSTSKLYKEQEQIQQLIEMKIISRPASSSPSLQEHQQQSSPQLLPSAVTMLQQQHQKSLHHYSGGDSSSLSDSLSSCSLGGGYRDTGGSSYTDPSASQPGYTELSGKGGAVKSLGGGSSNEASLEYNKLESIESSDGPPSSLGSIV